MCEPVLRGKVHVHVILAGALSVWQISVVKFIHFNPVKEMAHCYKVGFLSVNEDVLANDLPW